MKVLFLDDDKTRTQKVKQELIGHHLTTVETASEAIAALKTGHFDMVSLDHDLGGRVFAASDENSGYAVAEYIAGLPPHDWPDAILIHSFNPDGADKMQRAIIKGGEVLKGRKNVQLHRAAFGTQGFWQVLGVKE